MYCIPKGDLRPFRHQALPPPRCPQAPSLPVLPSEEDVCPTVKRPPCPKMIRAPQPPREPSFVSPSKKQFLNLHPYPTLSLLLSCTSASENRRSFQRPAAPSKSGPANPPAASRGAAPILALKKKQGPTPSKPTGTVKKPVLMDPSSDSKPGSASDSEEYDANNRAAVLGDEDKESDKIEVPLVKRFQKMTADKSSLPPPCAYHPLTGEPLTGLLYVSFTAPAMPVPLLPPAEFSFKAKGKEKAVAPSSPTSPSLHSHAVQ
ncbi:hypothetical protein EDD85DRAFT_795612 [Armillaria nabsnona]|nr:hypothetical protein EDD85DRAFT_795612 [Armillaria nabsnona]